MIDNNRKWTAYVTGNDFMLFILEFIQLNDTQITPWRYIQVVFEYNDVVQILNLQKKS